MTRFATFEIDLRARELRKGGIRIRLQDQPFEILAMMLDRPGEVVTREELRQRLWPAGTFVDFEHSLNAAVKRLRAALGDDADNPRFVETLHRRGYRFIAPVESIDNGSRAVPAATPSSVRLVVLPFDNLSSDPAQEYFSDGLTEEMITQIGRLCPRKLGVIARTSSIRFKRSGKSVSEIGRELAVDYLLEGSVRHEGDRVRITAQLIETRTEVHLWADTYDRRLEEVLMLQSDVAARIAHSLAMELVPDRREALERVAPRRSEAYQAYLKGRFHWNRTGDEGFDLALTYYERALDLDPGFAAAHAAMARLHVALAEFSRQPGLVALERARTSAERALELDPGIADAHVALAEVQKGIEWNWSAAEAHYRRAIALASSCEAAHRYYGVFLTGLSRFDEARRESEHAFDVDPLCLAVNTAAAWGRYVAGDFDEAVERCQSALEMDRSYTLARRLLGASHVAAGRHREGIAELEQASGPVSRAWLAHARGVAGQRDLAGQIIQQLLIDAKEAYVPAYHLALAYSGSGDADAAFAMLARACDERDPALINLRVEPRLAGLRTDARFLALVTQLGIAA